MNAPAGLIQHLTSMPLTWLLATLLAYRLALIVHRRVGNSPWLHPVAVATAIIAVVLMTLDVDYDTYFAGGQYIHILLRAGYRGPGRPALSSTTALAA